MKKTKRLNVISVIVAFVLFGVLVYFVKPTKLLTYARAKFGVSNQIYIYKLNPQDKNYKDNKDKLGSFFKQRGISGTAYSNNEAEYYVTIVPSQVNPKTEINFGFKQVTPEEFYRTVYNTKQAYFTRTLRLIED